MKIKSRLHILMHDNNVKSVSQLSELTKISRPTLYRLYNETGDRIEYDTIAKLCNHFKCTVGELLEFVPEKGEG